MLAQHAAALADASGGRFVLGLGASSNVIVERWNEVPFEKPLTRLRETIPMLREVLAGGRGAGGFKLETPPAQPVPIVLAALRDKMLRLGGELADGTFTNFLPLSAAEHVVARVREGEAGREPTEVICRFFCIPGDGLDTARFMFAAYATVPVYEAFFRGLGWSDAIDPMVTAWRGGDRRAALAAVPEELVREIFIFGDPPAMRARLGEYVERGITTLVLTPIAAPDRAAGPDRRAGAVSEGLVDGRCWWGSSTPEYIAYHDEEWGRPVRDSRALFEKLCLEAFQSGLSWITILRKRENFRAAFAGFEVERVAAFGERDVARLMADAGIVRNRAKIDATINNARAAIDLDLAELLWSFAPEPRPRPRSTRRRTGVDARVGRDGEGAQEAGIPLRRPDDRLRDDAGLRARRRPPRGVPRHGRPRKRFFVSSARSAAVLFG